MFVRNRSPIPVTGGLSDTILKDSTNTQFIARDDNGSFTYVMLDGAPYTPVPPITALYNAGASTAAKQDDQIIILDEISSGLNPLSTAAKQDVSNAILDAIMSAVATAANQVTANGYLATIAGNTPKVTMDYRQAAAMGMIPGARTFILPGNAVNVQTAQAPCLLWDAKIPYPWQTAGQSLEVYSDNANDTSGGTGARSVVVTVIDSAYAENTYLIPLNGTTGVPIPGNNLFVQRIDVVQSGSAHTNVGTIRVRIVGSGSPGTTLGFIGPSQGSMHAFLQTVPAGKQMTLDNFYIDTLSGNKAVDIELDFCIRLPDGTIQVRQENFAYSANTPNNPVFLTPFRVPERTSVFIQVSSLSANGANISVSAGGVISNI